VLIDIDDGRRLSCFTFHQNESYEDAVLHVSFHTCTSGCSGAFRAPLFHSHCFEFKRRLGPVTPRFLAATEYSSRPPSSEVRRWSDLIRSRLPPKLRQALPLKLPPEILAMIAELLIHDCAVVMAQEQTLQDAPPSESLLDVTPCFISEVFGISNRKQTRKSCCFGTRKRQASFARFSSRKTILGYDGCNLLHPTLYPASVPSRERGGKTSREKAGSQRSERKAT
jgi:hypothetical protein